MSTAKTRKPISFAIAKLYSRDIPFAVCIFAARFTTTVSNSYYIVKGEREGKRKKRVPSEKSSRYLYREIIRETITFPERIYSRRNRPTNPSWLARFDPSGIAGGI